MSKGQAHSPVRFRDCPQRKIKGKEKTMERYSIALHGIDSYTKQASYIIYYT